MTAAAARVRGLFTTTKVTNGLMMDLMSLTATDRRKGRHARTLVMLCFAVAGVILAASLLWPAGSGALETFTAMPR